MSRVDESVSTEDQRPDADAADRLTRYTGAADPLPEARPAPVPAVLALRRSARSGSMAVSGIALLGFVLAHMIGNLKVYLGQTAAQRLRRVAAHPRRARAARAPSCSGPSGSG